MNQEPERFEIVQTSMGTSHTPVGSFFKSRGWLLLNGSYVLCVPDTSAESQGVGINRITFDNVLSSSWNEESKNLIVNLTDGTKVSMNSSGCGCGFGAVGNAGPTSSPYTFTRVANPPPWHTNT